MDRFLGLLNKKDKKSISEMFKILKSVGGANVSIYSDSRPLRTTPLILAIEHENPGLVKALLKAGADIDKRTLEGYIRHPYEYGVEEERFQMTLDITTNLGRYIKNLVDGNFNNDDIREGDSATPLLRAITMENIEIVKILLDHGADVESVNLWGCAALNHACRDICEKNDRMYEICKILLEKKGFEVDFYRPCQTHKYSHVETPVQQLNNARVDLTGFRVDTSELLSMIENIEIQKNIGYHTEWFRLWRFQGIGCKNSTR